MTVINEIFSLVMKFKTQISCIDLTKPIPELEMKSLNHLRRLFKEYSTFLFKILTRLQQKGYQKHLGKKFLFII